ncbi:MAG: hypothetical protein WBR24_03520 [Desulfobacterales bacterium]
MYLFVRVARDANAAARCQTLQPRRDVDTVAIYPITVRDHIAEIDADSENHFAVVRQRGVTFLYFILNLQGAFNRIDGTDKLGQYIVTGRVDNPAVMTENRAAYFLPVRLEGVDRVGFVQTHQTAVAFDIRTQYGRQFSFELRNRHRAISQRLDTCSGTIRTTRILRHRPW